MAQRRGKQRRPAGPPDEEHSASSAHKDPDEAAGPIPDMMRRALSLGLSGFFTTEGALRKALEDTVPKDWTDFLTETSDRTRSEFFERLSTEIGRVLETVDIAAVIKELMEGRTLEVKAEFRLSDTSREGENAAPTIRFSASSPSRAEAHDEKVQGDD